MKAKCDFVVKYPIWVSIKRMLMGKLVVDDQNLINCVRFEENVQYLRKSRFLEMCKYRQFLDDFFVWENWIFHPVAALQTWFKCTSFEYQHRIIS